MAEGKGEDRHKAIASLADEVIDKIGKPLDKWAVAAALESIGMRDADAIRDFDKLDLFALAEDVFAHCMAREWEPRIVEKLEELTWRERLKRFLRFYVHGLLFALPMAGQIFAVLLLGYSLWASLRFTEREGTVVAFGTILSFFVTGGFVQAIGRRGYFYLEQGNYILAREICLRLIKVGTLMVIVAGLLTFSLSLVTPFFSHSMLPVALVYYFLLSELWLCLAVLYVLKERVAILVLTVTGAVIVYLLSKFTPLVIFFAHWIGLAVTDILVFAWGYRMLDQKVKSAGKRPGIAHLPRPSILIYSTAPYFIYGILYFAFLFADRLVAWSVGPKPPFYLIWFKTPYEWGLDWALISLILSTAVLEYTINEFAKLIIPVQKLFDAFHIAEHNRFFRLFHRRQVNLLLVTAVISAVIAYLMALFLPRFFGMRNILEEPVIWFVFFGGVIGYNLLAWGLMNGVFLFSLSRPGFVLKAISAAIVLGVATGFLLSRVRSYEWSVVGLVVGSLVFGVLTTWYAFRLLDRLDYYYYSAY
ncbi:MAG: hypothetical protein DRI61_16595 [Chloroflexi bacterium]|nr:MAG: hypothetical protein DRI61_16595 [Chloroflexota bacterium]HDN78874.1 hypothetical protein [Chloroflexota bacterium]